METNILTIEPQIMEKVNIWLNGNYDEQTKNEIRYLIQNNPKELIDAFYTNMEFGTGGMRGIMGAGINRMNIYTVGMATQGLCNYLLKAFPSTQQIKVAIGYDSRNNSKSFATTAAEIFSANGIKAYLFDDLRPVPELSFAIRYLKCQCGVVITASHNPKEYNGYKVYWEDGAQIVNPHDKNIIEEVKKITNIDDVKFKGKADLIEIIGEQVDNAYLSEVKKLSLHPEAIERNKGIKIVYTPLHGSGIKLVPVALREFGFTNIYLVEEQSIPDGNFPTTKSPNPEEPAALEMALSLAKKLDADLVLATDPDADRVGIAVKDYKGNFILLNGNQMVTLLTHYLLDGWQEKGKITGKEYIISTIVTTDILFDIAKKFNVNCYATLTGFKYIAEIIREKEKTEKYIGGGEESYGYLPEDFVRDKDAVSTCCLIAEACAYAIDKKSSLFDYLLNIYLEYGFYKEVVINIYRKGKEGAEEIVKMMDNYRNSPPQYINNSKVVKIIDYLKEKETGLPRSNVLQFFTDDGSKISVRPSGTEPKIKFYFQVKEKFTDKQDYEKINKQLDEKIEMIIKDMKLSGIENRDYL